MYALLAHPSLEETLGFDPGTTPAIREDLFPVIGEEDWKNLAAGDLFVDRWIVHNVEKWRDVLARADLDEGSVNVCS